MANMWTKYNWKDKTTHPETIDTPYGQHCDVYVKVGGQLIFHAIYVNNHFEHMFAKTLQYYGYSTDLRYSDALEWKYV